MLESNTDRSYFMIGAVIVAAVLIAGALFIFRDQLFAGPDVDPTTGEEIPGTGGYVYKLVSNLFGDANDMVDDINTSVGH